MLGYGRQAWAFGCRILVLGGRGCGRCCIYHAAGVGGRSRFPIFLLRMVGAGDIKFMALVAGCFGLERGFWSVVIGLCLGAVLALGKMLQEGSVCQRFLYLTAYIRRFIQSKEIEAYYCPERDGYKCVIPLGACFFAGTLITALVKG